MVIPKGWKTLAVRDLHRGLLTVEEHDVETHDGRRFSTPVIRGPRSVLVCAVTVEEQVAIVEQHRYRLDMITSELPAGVVEDGEASLQAAAREVHEESGLFTGDIELMSSLSVGGGISDEITDMYLATGCSRDPDFEPAAGEEARGRLVSFDQVLALPAAGVMPADSVACLLLAARRLKR